MFEEYGLALLVNLITGYLAFRYTEVILTARFAKRRTALWGWLVLYTAGQSAFSYGLDVLFGSQAGAYGGMIQLISCALLLFSLQAYYFQRNWPRQIFALASFVAGWSVLRFAVSPLAHVVLGLWNSLWGYLVNYSFTQGWLAAEQLLEIMAIVNQVAVDAVLLICRVIQLGIFALYLWLIGHYFCHRDYELTMMESAFLLIPCVTVLTIDLTFRVMAFSVDNSALMLIYDRVPETLFLLPLVSLLLLGLIVAAVILFRGVVQYKEAEAKRLLLENGITDIHRQVEEMQDIYRDMRGLRHDLRGHIESLTAYVHNHLDGEQTEIENYLAQMTNTTARLDFADKTGHPITDIILHQSRQRATKKSIGFEASFHYPDNAPFDIYDISVILNNGLKNALEACEKINPPGKLEVRSYAKGRLFFIEIENDFIGDLDWAEEIPVTTKADKAHHGIGLENIARCAQKYKGSMDIEVIKGENKQRFRLTVMLYQ